ncbi:MAG: DinB family protein [Candidatus Bipolaricaulota bacterium]
MNEIKRIQRQMKLLHLDEGWASITLRSLLEDICTREAQVRPISGKHSIWEIVLHLGTAQQLVFDGLRGVTRPFTSGDEWPSVDDLSDAAWAKARQLLFDTDEEVRQEIERLPASTLEQPFVVGGSSAYDVFHGYIQHAYYHAGQISVLKTLKEA